MEPMKTIQTMWKRMGDEIVTLNRRTHQYHVLNSAAALIFESATGENSEESIAAKIAESYDIDLASALKDTRETIAAMKKLGLLDSPQRIRYQRPAIKEVTQEDFDAAIAEGTALACRSLLGA